MRGDRGGGVRLLGDGGLTERRRDVRGGVFDPEERRRRRLGRERSRFAQNLRRQGQLEEAPRRAARGRDQEPPGDQVRERGAGEDGHRRPAQARVARDGGALPGIRL